MARPRLAAIKLQEAYTVEEAAETVGVTEQTIRGWIKRGMPALTAQRPTLIMGFDLKGFAATHGRPPGIKLSLGEFRCFTCKAPREAAFGMADYRALTDKRGQLHAFCKHCGRPVSRFVGRAKLGDWQSELVIGGNFDERA